MHLRDIDRQQFDRIALELSNAHRRINRVEVITGDHDDHGAMILIGYRGTFIAIVHDPALLSDRP